MKTTRITRMAILTAVALTIFMVEAQIPPLTPIPGIKLGLANIVTVYAVFALGAKDAAEILGVRVILGAIFAGQIASLAYSAAGGALAILVTILLRHVLTRKQLWIAGCLGAIAHNVGQIVVAIVLTGTPSILLYLPVLIISGTVTGLFTGLCAQFLLERLKWK